jgi:glycosidase
MLLIAFLAAACASAPETPEAPLPEPEGFVAKRPLRGNYGVWYEIFVGSFYDSDGNGTGDLRGIIEKLDYLNDGNLASSTSLHVDGIWLMPIMPSPSYHKYDTTDYCAIDRAYGTMADFEALLAACRERGIKVIIDLAMNHTSIAHPWFRRAQAGDPKYLPYYSTSATKQSDKYYPLGFNNLYYEGVFWDQMPDLNFDHPDVKAEFEKIADFWLDKGVAGFRLDAVKHVYVDQAKGTDWLRWFTRYCKSKKADVYLVGEMWDTTGAILAFYESGVPSLFNFALAQKTGLIPQSVGTGNGQGFATAMVNLEKLIRERNPGAIDAPFISNHDIDRSADFFAGDLVRQKMAAALYLFTPGNPFIYYGEELGMRGSGRDENKRGPMIWSVRNRKGQTRGPWEMDYRWKPAAGLREQLADAASLPRFYIEAVKLKNRYPVTFYGVPALLPNTDRALAAYTLSADGVTVGVLHNLSAAEKTLPLPGAVRIGGFLAAQGGEPRLEGAALRLPAFSTVLVEM